MQIAKETCSKNLMAVMQCLFYFQYVGRLNVKQDQVILKVLINLYLFIGEGEEGALRKENLGQKNLIRSIITMLFSQNLKCKIIFPCYGVHEIYFFCLN